MSTWLVTGASRGLGAQIAQEALDAGHCVIATARRPEEVRARFAAADPGQLTPAALDVTDAAAALAVAKIAEERFGGVDVLVNNAGRGLLGAVEEVSDSEARAVYDTNVFGLMNVLRAVLPGMRARRSGHVFNISSVGGFTTGTGWGVYGSTKFAAEGLSEALAQELAPLGIRVTIVEPGYFRTDFLDSSSLHRAAAVLDDYADSAGRVREVATSRNHDQPGDPAKAARAIVELAASAEPPLRMQLGRDSVERVEAKLRSVQTELDQWRAVALSTDHDD
jgi:NAD(P)-dependent dehydrogenase (short-subunit alcohol dehydrogenase family)